MPGREYYHGLSLAEKLRRCAEHHYDPHTRHLARYEYEMLLEAAETLRQHEHTSVEPEPVQPNLSLGESA